MSCQEWFLIKRILNYSRTDLVLYGIRIHDDVFFNWKIHSVYLYIQIDPCLLAYVNPLGKNAMRSEAKSKNLNFFKGSLKKYIYIFHYAFVN